MNLLVLYLISLVGFAIGIILLQCAFYGPMGYWKLLKQTYGGLE